MSYAEAGDLDAVKAILDQREPSGAPVAATTAAPGEIGQGFGGAKILEFKRAKPATAAEPVF